jgi:lipopolysaccharide transport system permease protein
MQPILLTGALTLVLGLVLSAPSAGLPYPLFVFAGTAIWSAFQRALTETSTSLANNSNLVLKVYFPRILVPAAALLTSIVDFIPIYGLLVVAVLGYGLFPGWPIIFSPLFIILALTLAFAIGLWVTMLDAIYRDFRVLVPSILQLVFYVSPVIYAATAVPSRWQGLYYVNPLAGILDGFRWSFIAGATAPSGIEITWCVLLTAALLLCGLCTFARLERFAVDRI